MNGSPTTDETLKQQKPSRTFGNKKDKKRWCRGKVGRDHVYEVGPPIWFSPGTYKKWTCDPWDTMVGYRWYCRHVMICCSCGRQEDLPSEECPDRPEDDGTIEFF